MPGAPIPPSNVSVGGPNHTLHHQQIHAKLAELDARGSLLQGAVFVTSDQTPPAGIAEGDWWLYPTGAGPEGVIASFTASLFGATVTVSAAGSQGTISDYTWEWGDGTANGSGVSASHTYTAGGTYTVKLTVAAASGASDFTTVILPTIHAVDTFERTVTGGTSGSRSWGDANIGGTWTFESVGDVNSGTNSMSVGTGRGIATIGTAGSDFRAALESVSAANFNILGQFSFASIPTAGHQYVRLFARQSAAGKNGNRYALLFNHRPVGSGNPVTGTAAVSVGFEKWVAGATDPTIYNIGTTLDRVSVFPKLTADEKFWIRFVGNGATLYCRIWRDGSTEPTTWDNTVTDVGGAAFGNVDPFVDPGMVTVAGRAHTNSGLTYTPIPHTTYIDHFQVHGS